MLCDRHEWPHAHFSQGSERKARRRLDLRRRPDHRRVRGRTPAGCSQRSPHARGPGGHDAEPRLRPGHERGVPERREDNLDRQSCGTAPDRRKGAPSSGRTDAAADCRGRRKFSRDVPRGRFRDAVQDPVRSTKPLWRRRSRRVRRIRSCVPWPFSPTSSRRRSNAFSARAPPGRSQPWCGVRVWACASRSDSRRCCCICPPTNCCPPMTA